MVACLIVALPMKVMKIVRNGSSRLAFPDRSHWTGAMADRRPARITRREALRSTVAASALAMPVTSFVLEQAHAYDPGRDETRARYRESDHVRAFYRVNGYETLKK